MVHPLVEQLRFSRSEFKRALEGLSEEDAVKRVLPANCIAWNVGHLAWQEQRYWLIRAAGRTLREDVNKQFAYGAEARYAGASGCDGCVARDHGGQRPVPRHAYDRDAAVDRHAVREASDDVVGGTCCSG